MTIPIRNTPSHTSLQVFSKGKLVGGVYRIEKFLGESPDANRGTFLATIVEGTPAINFRGEKVILRIMPPDEEFAEDVSNRLKYEINTLRKLTQSDTRSIPRISALGRDGNHNYIVMEYLEGRTLEHYFSQRGGAPYNLRDTLRICAPVCEALRIAHSYDIIHRRVQPSSVLIRRDGNMTLTSFGSPQPFTNQLAIRSGEFDVTLIQNPYLAPEIKKGGNYSPSSDMYGLGGLIFECITGQEPQEGLLPSEVDSNISNALDDITLMLLNATPEGRPTAQVTYDLLKAAEPKKV